ncbi:nucleoside-diphosphate sugar epimerase/dehydratase [Parasedimentitalea marina]|uniref:nucleoside-diphosphate sugar epimerase/dehydratase n=1 Tax=Parasedimentitalea marina TaxID=2483033 RepID=UPI003B846DC5
MFDLISRLSRKQKSYVFLTLDALLCPLALFFTFVVQPLPDPALQTLALMVPVLPYAVLVTAGTSVWLGLYRVKLNAYERHAMMLTALVAVLTATVLALLTYMVGPDLPPGTYVVFGLFYFVSMALARAIMLQLTLVIYRRMQPRCRVLIYGAGATGTQLAQALKSHDGIDPVAFVDDNTSLQGATLLGLPVHTPTDIAEIVANRGIRRVLLAMPSQSVAKQAQITRRLQALDLEVQVLPSFAQLIGEEALVDKLTPASAQSFLGRDTRDVPLNAASQSYQDRVVLVSGAGDRSGPNFAVRSWPVIPPNWCSTSSPSWRFILSIRNCSHWARNLELRWCQCWGR